MTTTRLFILLTILMVPSMNLHADPLCHSSVEQELAKVLQCLQRSREDTRWFIPEKNDAVGKDFL